ncbi:MAG: RepB family plasmid replication initiator protein [Rubricoccaceae bacterium]|nr:RepB family plasmid replication initiator protein [Rubricoccaceae bacterium]
MNGLALRKHTGAIHIKAPLTMLQRKIANVLLLNAYDELPDPAVSEHQISIGQLASVAGFDSNDYAYLRDALTSLVDHKIEWNILNDGKAEWGIMAFLSQASIRDAVCTYAYPPVLRRELHHPRVFAVINLKIQARLRSSYALALYENCVRYRRVQSTGFRTVELWRDLLGVDEGEYPEYKYLNRSVLKPAVREVNKNTDIRVQMHTLKTKGRITHLRFSVHDNEAAQGALDEPGDDVLNGKRLPDPRTLAPSVDDLLNDQQMELLSYGLTPAQVIDLGTEYNADRIKRNLAYVEREIGLGRIRRVPAFVIAAVRDDYAAADASDARRQPVAAATDRRRVQRQAEADAAQERAERLEAAWSRLSPAERARIDDAALDRLRRETPFVFRKYEAESRDGSLGPGTQATLRALRYEEIERAETQQT